MNNSHEHSTSVDDEGASNPAQTLRRRAEEKFRTLEDVELKDLGPEVTRQLLHELRVHQIELEIQNEDLCRAQAELDAARARYFDLYDFAPVAYLSLNEAGIILQANLTAATLLGVPRTLLLKQPLSGFIPAWGQGYLLSTPSRGPEDVFGRCAARHRTSGLRVAHGKKG